MTPIEKLIPEIVKALLEISPWPWGVAEGNFVVYDFANNDPNSGQIAAEVPCQGGKQVDLNFIASSPLWLASLVVGIVESETLAIYWHHISHAHLVNNPICQKEHAGGFKEFERKVLAQFCVTPSDYEELKRRVEG